MSTNEKIETSTKKMYVIDVTKIEFTKRAGGNVRKDFGDLTELENSILANGVLQPITAYRNKEKAGYWFATDGERRLTAAKNLIEQKKSKQITCVVSPIDEKATSDEDILYTMFNKNSGKELTVIENAELVKRLIDKGQTPKAISEKIGKSLQFVYTLQHISGYSKKLKSMIENKEVSYTLCEDLLKQNGGDLEAMEQKIISASKEARAISEVAAERVNELFEGGSESVDTTEAQPIKITKKNVKQKNSFKDLKAALKQIDKKSLTIKNKEVYDFAKGIVNNEFDKEYILALIQF